MQPDTLAMDAAGYLSIAGIRVADLARRYGTPLYVFDLETLDRRLAAYRVPGLPVPVDVYYAGKAFLCTAMAGFLADRGVGLDAVSGGELFTALAGGLDAARIVFHGNVKTPLEITQAVEAGVGAVVVDSLDELGPLAQEARRQGRTVPVLVRVTPGIEAHTHAFIRTGQYDSKFGFALTGGLAEAAVQAVLAEPALRLIGLHSHIGSQILDLEPFVANVEVLMGFSRHLARRYGWWPQVLDVGGGLGVRYQPEDDPPPTAAVLEAMARAAVTGTPAGREPPRLAVEPGRSIVAEAGVTIYRIGAMKTVPGGRRYWAVDGGMGDNIRPALYQARYQALVDGRRGPPEETVTLAGRYCESGDILIQEARLPAAAVGDLVVVLGTGAYNYAMASNYNRVPRPAVVTVRNGTSRVWVEREGYSDLLRLDRPWEPW
ncbi:meso-2,6-diaminopimelate decarboxylase [Candidatus Hydrogenisulfobacillus filiaventi]|uniref:Diaminopimelate decarboxylase n=1 Tax=Candidatus Hydrogenisulfobacillus filiaventi TaxID=2707344 RepID=A0A6F8ZGW1_9FIRM|nr:diaminopimelate decarboxylase [Bacillota bacterium]CAB1128695.1 meso-2,6-diaminopimelate decarboxylase [Candidatus Hydrogenisulfobacillus filiaventi]